VDIRPVGPAQGAPLAPAEDAVEEARPPAVLGLEQLGAQVVMVENVSFPEQLEEHCDREKHVGRIAELNHVEAAANGNPQR
jgi:hypothetical protein